MESWVAYAISCYVSGEYDNCISAIETVKRFDSQAKKPMRPVEKLEICVLNFKALEAKGHNNKAMKNLLANEADFIDKIQYLEFCARIKGKTGDIAGSIMNYEKLLV
jgi:hypothetical protein